MTWKTPKDLTLQMILDRYSVAELVVYQPLSEQALACCAEHGVRTMVQLRKAAQAEGGLRARFQCSTAEEEELMSLLAPPGIPAQWPALTDAKERIQQHYAHLSVRCRTALNGWVFEHTNPALALQYLVHSDLPFDHIRSVGAIALAELLPWRAQLRTIVPVAAVPITRKMLQSRQPFGLPQPERLEAVLNRSLQAFAKQVLHSKWYGKEREAVSYYAFGQLVRQCKAGSPLYHPAQIAIEGRLPGSALNKKKEVCKDLVIWPTPGGNCWNAERKSQHYPLAVMEWKANGEEFSAYDIKHLVALTTGCPGMLGLVVTFHAVRKNVFRVARILNGEVQYDWLEVR
ncbi:MAG: hypothetical protein ABI599_07860 [Flavobacteriales bacterium]